MSFFALPTVHYPLSSWLLALVAAFFIGFGKAGFSGLMMITIVLMAWIFGAKESVGIVLPLLIVGDFGALRLFGKHGRWSEVLPLLVPAAIGVVLGYFLLDRLSSHIFSKVIGWLILGFVVLKWLLDRYPQRIANLHRAPSFGMFCGIAAGITTTLANAAGPVVSIYLLLKQKRKLEFLGLASRFFLAVNWMKVPFNWQLGLIDAQTLRLNAMLVPGVLLGLWAGQKLVSRVSQRWFERLVTWFAIAAAIKLIGW